MRDDLRALLADVACLPEDQGAALVLTQLGDLSHAEIAATLGCSPAQVEALVFQARRALVDGRAARDTSCAEFREQIAAARGATLRRAVLRRHLSMCAGCRAFRDATRAERRTLGAWLPLAPLAWLRSGLLAVFGPGAAGGGAALGGTGLAAAVLATAALPVAVVAQRAGRDDDGARVRVAMVAREPVHDAEVRGGGPVAGRTDPSTRQVLIHRRRHRAASPAPAASPRPTPAAIPPAVAGPEPDVAQARPAAKTPPRGDTHAASGHAAPGHGRPDAGKAPRPGTGQEAAAGQRAEARQGAEGHAAPAREPRSHSARPGATRVAAG